MEEIEKKLIEYYKKDIEIPDTFESAIIHSFDKKEKYKRNYIKYAIALLIISILSINIGSFAYTYYKYKVNNNLGLVTDSLEEAVYNGYLQNVEMEYKYSNGIGVKVDYVIMSDYNLNILFNFYSDRKEMNNTDISLEDLIIYDENKNVLYCYNGRVYKEYCKLNNISYKRGERINQYSSGCSWQIMELDLNTSKILYKIRSIKGFPKSKKLYISFHTIENCKENKKIASGNWNIELNLPEKFYTRNNTYYTFSKKENEESDIKTIEMVVTDTMARLYLSMLNYKINSSISMCIIDENGKKYDMNIINEGMYRGKGNITATFPINNMRCTDKLKLVVNIDGKESIFELEKI